jgi:hypothetical protein
VQTLQTFLCEELHLGLRENEPLGVSAG